LAEREKIMNILYTTWVFLMSFRYLLLPVLGLSIVFYGACRREEELRDILYKFFKKLRQNGHQTEWYLRMNHIAVFVVSGDEKKLLVNAYLNKRQLKQLNTIGYVKSGRSFVVEGYEGFFNY